jgi:hypothetical protein
MAVEAIWSRYFWQKRYNRTFKNYYIGLKIIEKYISVWCKSRLFETKENADGKVVF